MSRSIHASHRLLLAALSLSLGSVLTGCGIGTLTHSTSGNLAMNGVVHGGQQAVDDSTIQLYRVGTAGNGSAATPMLNAVVTTDVDGFFNITGDYTCANATDQVYIVSSGGNPGLAPGTDNTALVLVDALGNCGNLSTIPYITINEVTTAAAAWSLAPFIASPDHIGSTATNSLGISNAMLGAQQLADPTTGMAATLPSNLTVESGKLYALANALASCVNSDGGAGCLPLLLAATPSGGTPPGNTFNAALNIVRNPGQNVAAVFGTITPTAPFPATLTQAPHDWTMSLTVTGGGMSRPNSLGVDALGTVWVVSYDGILSAFSPEGAPLSATGYGVGTLGQSYGLTIDSLGNIWVTNETQPGHSPFPGSLTKFLGTASGSPGTIVTVGGSPYIYDATVAYPFALAADTNGNVAELNYFVSTATVFNNAGTDVLTTSGGGTPDQPNLDYPTSLVFDQSHGLWIANNSDSTITHLAADGSFLSRPDCCGGSDALAMDASGNVWSANYSNSSVSEVANNGAVSLMDDTAGGLAEPSGISVDAAGNVWVSNHLGDTFSELAGNGGSLTVGTALSPSTGYGLDSSLFAPFGIVPDATGSLWVSSYENDQLVKFFGLATPTVTPVNPAPSAP